MVATVQRLHSHKTPYDRTLSGRDTAPNAGYPAELVRKAGLCGDDETPQVETLGGGISNLVSLVRTGRGAWVVKQALPQLRVKDEWLAARRRIYAEAACLRLIRQVNGEHPAPAVLFEDRENFACILEYGGDGCRTWKQDLMSGLAERTNQN